MQSGKEPCRACWLCVFMCVYKKLHTNTHFTLKINHTTISRFFHFTAPKVCNYIRYREFEENVHLSLSVCKNTGNAGMFDGATMLYFF